MARRKQEFNLGSVYGSPLGKVKAIRMNIHISPPMGETKTTTSNIPYSAFLQTDFSRSHKVVLSVVCGNPYFQSTAHYY